MFEVSFARRIFLRSKFIAGGVFSIGIALGALSSTRASSLSWDQTGSGGLGGTGTWNTSTTNWWNGTSDVAWSDTTGTADIATFAGSAGTVSLGTNLGALGLVFNTTGYTVATGANTLTLGSSGIDASGLSTGTTTISGNLALGANQTWNVGSGATLTASAIISGSGLGITKTGAGTLTLTGLNTYTGGTSVNGGTLSVAVASTTSAGGANPGPAGTGAITLNGGILNSAEPNSGASSFNITVANNIVIGTGTNSIRDDSQKDLNLTGTLSGSGNVTIGDSSTVATLHPTMTNSMTGGTITFGSTNANVVRIGSSAFGNANVAWVFNAPSGKTTLEFGGNPTIQFGSMTGTGDLQQKSNGSTTSIQAGALGLTDTFSGTMTQFATNGGTLAFTKVGSGTMTLSGANAYTGATTISGGILSVGTIGNGGISGNLGAATNAAANLVFDGGTLRYTGATAGTNRNFTINAGKTATFDITTNNLTVSGASTATTGALTKTGAGTLTLTGTNLYTGATTVSSGTLVVSGTGGINSSSGITINGSTAKYVKTSSTVGTVPITLTQGTLDGTGAVGAVAVGNGTGGIVTNGGGNGGTSALTMSSLTFNGAGTINLNKANDTSTVGLAVTNAFTTTAANGQITLNVLTAPAWANGNTYNLISYGSFNGATTDFTLGTVTGLGVRQSATLGNTGASNGFITLAIAGDTPVWTGAANGNWTTDAQPSPYNWKLQTAGTATQFLTNDQVLFDDSATGTTALKITGASVSPASVVFNNSSKNYSVSSDTGLGIASGTLSKSGTGSLTLNTANTYNGGTTLNGGTLNVNNASAIGTGSLTIAAGTTIDNTNGSAITLSTNNAQFWDGNFTFGGSNDLNLGTGAVTLGASVFLTTNGSKTLTVGGVIGGSGFSIFKEGTGTLALNGANTFDGGVTIDGGTVQIGNASALGTSANPLTFGSSSNGKLQVNGIALTLSALNGDNTTTIENSNVTNGSLSVGSGFFDGILQNGSAGTLALTKTGSGTLTLTGANTYSGGTTLNGGTLSVSGNSALGAGTVIMAGGTTISSSAGATLPNAFTLNGAATFTAVGGAMVLNGNITGSPNGNWTLTPTNKITLGGTNSLTFSAANLGLIINAGSVDITGSTTIDGGANSNSGYATVGNQTSITLTILNGGSLTIKGTTGNKPGTIVGQNGNSSGILNVGAIDKSSGGTLNIGGNTAFILGNNNATASGTLNVNSGTATITAGSTTLQDPLNYIAMGRDNGTGIINLNGGTLATGRQFVRDGGTGGTQGAGTAIFNFNGGLLQAQADQTQGNGWFETATTGNFQVVTTNVLEGGAIIDTNGFTVNIQSILAHGGSNAIDGGLTKIGAGTLSLGSGSDPAFTGDTFTGNVAVNAGTLSLASDITLNSAIVLSLASNTTLDLGFISGSQTVQELFLNGTAVAPGTYSASDLTTLGSSSSITVTSFGGTLTVTAVPEPGTVALVSLGLLFGLFAFRRSKVPTTS